MKRNELEAKRSTPLKRAIPALAVVCLVSACLSHRAGLASAPGRGDEILERAIRSSLERAGDLDGLALQWVETISEHPGDFRCELLARRLREIRPSLRDERRLIDPLERLLAATPGPAGTTRQVLIDILADLYHREGREEDRERLESDRGFLLRWQIIGPFGKDEAAPMDLPFPPETEQREDAVYRDGWQELRWRPLARKRPEPLLNPFEHVYPSRGVTYLLAQVRSDEERPAVLHRGSSESLKIWVNGHLVVDDDFEASYLSSRRRTPLRLAEGWNRVLVKSRTGFWARFSDPQDDPFPAGALVEETGGTIHPAATSADPRWDGPARPEARELWADWISGLAACGDEPVDSEAGDEARRADAARILADARMGLAILHEDYSQEPLAVREAEKALELLADDAALLFHAGGIFRSAGYLPSNVSKNRAKAAFEAVLQHDDGFVPAYERMARFLAEDEQYPQAAAKVREGLERGPGYLPLLLRLRAIYSQQGWLPEEIATVREIEAAAPTSGIPASFWSSYYRQRGNVALTAEYVEKAFELDRRQTGLLLDLAMLHKTAGALAKVDPLLEEAIRREPNDERARRVWAEFLLDTGRPADAARIAREICARSPQDPAPQVWLAEILERSGDEAAALAAYDAALELEPGNVSLRRYVDSLRARDAEGAVEDAFWSPYDERLEDWLDKVPDEGALVEKADSVLILDISVLRLEEDGSYSEYIHQAFRLRTEESKEALANQSTGEETIVLRTVTPEGETLEPVPAQGRRSFVMPGLAVGATVEVAYRNDTQRARGMEYRGNTFYFQDTQFQSPFLLSRYVLLISPGVDPGIVETKIGELDAAATDSETVASVEKTERRLEDGTTVLIYEARNTPRIEREPYMPASDEYIPNVELLQKRSWSEVASLLESRYRGATRLTPELEAAAAEAVGDRGEPMEKARAVYGYVNDLIANDSGPGHAAGILLEKGGNRTVLFKALLDASGVPSTWVYLRPREEFLPKTEWTYPSPSHFPYPYVRVEVPGGEPVYVSMASRNTPMGRLPEYLQGGKVFLPDPGGPTIELLPGVDLDESASSVEGSLKLTDEAEVAIDMRIVSRTQSAWAQKDRLRTLPAFQKGLALRTLANQLFPGARVETADFPGIEDPAEPFVIALKLVAPRALQERGDDRLLKAVLQPVQLVRAFCQRPRREHPFHFRNQIVMRDSVEVDSGSGFAVAAAPTDVLLTSPLGTYSLVYRQEGGVIRVARDVTLLPGRIAPQDFPAFVEFCRQVDAAEQESIVFRAKP